MKSLNQTELENMVEQLQALLPGCQLQDIQSNDRGIALGFQGQEKYWLILDLVPVAPMMVFFKDFCPFKKSLKTKPVGLFLNSHCKNLQVRSIEVLKEFGRVVRLVLSSRDQQKICDLELRLIPKQANLIVKTDGKMISWEKPVPLSPALNVELPSARTLEEIHISWIQQNESTQKPSLDPVAQFEKQKAKDLEKKRRALIEIQKQIESEEAEVWGQVGHQLKQNGLSEFSKTYQKYVNLAESLSWNIENCFTKAKQLANKKQGARERLESLAREISQLESKTYSASQKKNSLIDLMQKTEARGRKLHLESGAIAYCGKSGADNLKLLRQAKSWDFWMHLKDYPGAHAIIHRQRDQEISGGDILKVAEWVAKESLPAKVLQAIGKLDLIIVECRFVRPIKGDKLGRVTFHSEKSYSFSLRHE